MKKIEILAPAGSIEAMKAAVGGGCDAVYMGGRRFGARAFAQNPQEEELLEAVDYMHVRGKSLYLTVNTLFKEREVDDLYDYLRRPYEQGLDAVIVQDIGVLHFLRKQFPKLDIHASTQMTITSAYGTALLEELGVKRVVPARELSLKEIKALRQDTGLEIEVFVHGALCYCYSGQCLFSSMAGGRSGNRGRCAQPCRQAYPHAYYLSPKDLCAVELIPDLVEAGIDSFKIEGRMKKPEYAAFTSHVYRSYTDRFLELGKAAYAEWSLAHKEEIQKDIDRLADLYNRGSFTKGYFAMYNGPEMMSMERPNHYGVAVAEVEAVKKGQMLLSVSKKLQGGDVIEVREKGRPVYEFTVKDEKKPGERFTANFLHGSAVRPGQQVYRTKNAWLLQGIAEDYLEKDTQAEAKGMFTAGVDRQLELTLIWENKGKRLSVTSYGDMVQKAQKQPVTETRIRGALGKTGDSTFVFSELSVEIQGDIFVPVSAVNRLRREAVKALERLVAGYYRREPVERIAGVNKRKDRRGGVSEYAVQLENLAVLPAVLAYTQVAAVYLQVAADGVEAAFRAAATVRETGRTAYLALPAICREENSRALKRDLTCAAAKWKDIDGFLVRNYEEIMLLHELQGELAEKKEVILDFNLYTMNREAGEFYRGRGISRFTAPVELSYQELLELGVEEDDLPVYGYLPLMTSAQCLRKNKYSCAKEGAGERNEKPVLTDTHGQSYTARNFCRYCYSVVADTLPLSLLEEKQKIDRLFPRRRRMDFTMETEEETRMILDAFLLGKGSVRSYTGHFNRGIQ